VNVVSPAPVPADHEAEPVGEDPPAASPEERDDEHEGEHDNEPGDDEHEFDD
jgi:hypothetical protein